MAVINSFLGPIRQTAGNMTFARWKGIETLRLKPVSVANPNTSGQQAQRAKFKLLGQIGRAFQPGTQVGLRGMAVKKSQYNAFVQLNYPFTSYSAPDASISVADVVVSKGPVGAPGAMTLGGTSGPAVLTVQIANNSDGNIARSTDKLFICVWDSVNEYFLFVDPSKTRATAATTFNVALGANWDASTVAVYAFFMRADSSETSDNNYGTHSF